MKQFNLEEYLKNPNKKVVTRDGRKVTRFLCTDLKNEFPIVAAVESCKGAYPEELLTYRDNGAFYNDVTIDRRDLFFATERKEGWANLYNRGNIDYIGCVYTSEEEAEENKDNKESYVATVKIEWEE